MKIHGAIEVIKKFLYFKIFLILIELLELLKQSKTRQRDLESIFISKIFAFNQLQRLNPSIVLQNTDNRQCRVMDNRVRIKFTF